MQESAETAAGSTAGRLSSEAITDALGRVLASEGFAASPRLQQFLTYVVEETIAGRGQSIRGKTIAADVYGRDLGEAGAQNIVRVEARRLRRLLDEYYAGAGADDEWRICIDQGGYAPRFQAATPGDAEEQPEALATRSGASRSPLIVISIPVLALIAAGLYAVAWWPAPEEAGRSQDRAVRVALRDRSMPSLQAANLAEEARGMLFPIFDVKRQQLALEMFRHSIELDPGLASGYAGAAQVLATLSMLSADAAEAADLQREADTMASKALELAPADAWAVAAKGWTLAVGGSFEPGLAKARLAEELAPEDGHVLDLVGVTAIVGRSPQLAADVSRPGRPRSGVGRFGARNIWGVAQLMLENYPDVIEAFEGAAATGAPVSPPTLIFSAVAYDQIGESETASRLVAELKETWPAFPATSLVRRIFHEGTPAERVILGTLAKNGFDDAR